MATTQTTVNFFDTTPKKGGSLCITDKRGCVLYASQGMADRTGYDVPQIVGKRPGELWGGQMDSHFYSHLWNVIEEKKRPFIGTVLNRRKNQESHTETLHITPLLNEAGEVVYFLEMQPFTHSEEFETEFMRLFSNQQSYATHLSPWVQQWVGIEELNTAETPDSFTHTVEHALVLPTIERFHYRQTDQMLIRAAQKDPDAFGILYQKYIGVIEAYFYHHLGYDTGMAEDLTQETFFRALRHLSAFHVTNASYKTYLLRVAHNILVNYYRQPHPACIDGRNEKGNREGIEDSLFITMAAKQVLAEAKDLLSETEYHIFTMKYLEEMKAREIATLLNKTENAIKLHLSRARAKIQKRFSA